MERVMLEVPESVVAEARRKHTMVEIMQWK